MTTTLTYTITKEALEASAANHRLVSYDADVAFYFFDTLEQHSLVVGRDIDVDVDIGFATSRTKTGHKALIELAFVTLTFKDADKALLFKLSHQESAA